MEKLKRFHKIQHVSDIRYPDDPPMEHGVMYIVDDSPYVQFACPCGCGNDVMLPTNKHQAGYHGWAFAENDGKVTLSPSVFSTGLPCKSHYFIRKNQIDWC